MNIQSTIIKLLLLFVFTAISVSGFAAKIVNVKGKKVYLSMEAGEFEQGDIAYVIANGKKRGVIKIVKTKGTKAIARLGKGKAQKGWTLAKREKKVKKQPEPINPATKEFKDDEKGLGRSFIGGMLGFASNSMTAVIEINDAGDTQETSMTGSGFSARVLYDYGLWQQIWFRGMLGLENFSATSGDLICGDDNDVECDATLSYMSLDLWGRYLFTTGTTRPWVGLGFDLLFPSSKESTAIQEDSITSTSVFALGGGLDYFISPTTYIPIQVEYGMYPSSDDVKANYIGLRAGVAFAW